MIRHCVFVRFRDTCGRAERDALLDALAALQGVLPGMVGFGRGSNASPEGLDQGFGEGFLIDFLDATARDAYLEDPRHRAIGARLVAAAEGGLAGLLVFDFVL